MSTRESPDHRSHGSMHEVGRMHFTHTWSFSIRGELFTLILGGWLVLYGDFYREQINPKESSEPGEERGQSLKLSSPWCCTHLPRRPGGGKASCIHPPHLTTSKTAWVWAEKSGQTFIPQEASHPRKNGFIVIRRKNYIWGVGIKAFTSWPSTRQINNWREFHRQKAEMVINKATNHRLGMELDRGIIKIPSLN